MKNLILTILILCFSVFAFCDDDEIEVPKKVDRVNFTEAALVVGDLYYKMDLHMKVFDEKGQELNRNVLTEGKMVTLELSRYKSGDHYQVQSVVIHNK